MIQPEHEMAAADADGQMVIHPADADLPLLAFHTLIVIRRHDAVLPRDGSRRGASRPHQLNVLKTKLLLQKIVTLEDCKNLGLSDLAAITGRSPGNPAIAALPQGTGGAVTATAFAFLAEEGVVHPPQADKSHRGHDGPDQNVFPHDGHLLTDQKIDRSAYALFPTTEY
jgi:hypothetical protein